jgi:hypothetical protein
MWPNNLKHISLSLSLSINLSDAHHWRRLALICLCIGSLIGTIPSDRFRTGNQKNTTEGNVCMRACMHGSLHSNECIASRCCEQSSETGSETLKTRKKERKKERKAHFVTDPDASMHPPRWPSIVPTHFPWHHRARSIPFPPRLNCFSLDF